MSCDYSISCGGLREGSLEKGADGQEGSCHLEERQALDEGVDGVDVEVVARLVQ